MSKRTNDAITNPKSWDAIEEHAERLLAEFPPVTDEQRQRVEALMQPNGLHRRAA